MGRRMVKYEIGQLIEECESVYSLVIAVAKRSRDIAADAQEKRILLNEKPVNQAIDEFSAHKFRVIEGYSEPGSPK